MKRQFRLTSKWKKNYYPNDERPVDVVTISYDIEGISQDEPIFVDRLEYSEDLSYPLQILFKQTPESNSMQIPFDLPRLGKRFVYVGNPNLEIRPGQSLEFNTTRVHVEPNEGKEGSITVYFYQDCANSKSISTEVL